MYNQQNKRVSDGSRVALLHRAPTAVQGVLSCCPSPAVTVACSPKCPCPLPQLCAGPAPPLSLQGRGLGNVQCWMLGVAVPVLFLKAWLELYLPWFINLFFAPYLYINFCEVIFGLNLGLWSLYAQLWLVLSKWTLWGFSSACAGWWMAPACWALCCGIHPCWNVLTKQGREFKCVLLRAAVSKAAFLAVLSISS